MSKITATLKIHETETKYGTYHGYKLNRYELTYSSDTDSERHKIRGDSLRNVLRRFLLRTRSYHHNTYDLKIDPSVIPAQAQRATRKFKEETDRLTRELLELPSDKPLPTGAQLDLELDKVYAKKIADLKQEIQQMQQEIKSMRKVRNIFGGLSLLSIIGLGILAVLTLASVIVFPLAIIIPVIILAATLAISTLIFWDFDTEHESLVRHTLSKEETLLKLKEEEYAPGLYNTPEGAPAPAPAPAPATAVGAGAGAETNPPDKPELAGPSSPTKKVRAK